jgi:hypothetical protein
MRTLLRRKETGLYFQGPDRWTTDPASAMDFRMIDRAIQFIRRWGLHDVELAFAFNDYQTVTSVPLEKIGLEYFES